jgi:hypothetical protein
MHLTINELLGIDDDLTNLRAENERLREALEFYMAQHAADSFGKRDDKCPCSACVLARRALRDPPRSEEGKDDGR